MIPALIRGFLPSGVHDTTVDEAVERFGLDGASRSLAGLALTELVETLQAAGANYLLVGGSFPTQKREIEDLDIVAVFATRAAIPSVAPHYSGAGLTVDVQYASEDEEAILNALVAFFRRDRDGEERGVLRIALRPDTVSRAYREPDSDTLRVVGLTYANRSLARTNGRRGLLVTIHGIMSHAPWNADLSRLASSQGWVVAPFIYGWKSPLILLQKEKRRAIVRRFSDWLYRVAVEEDLPVSVVAHSLGSYIAIAYLLGLDSPLCEFNTLILTGAILNKDLDWNGRLAGRVRHVLHERTPSDPWVARMLAPAWISGDELMGNAGVVGFTQRASFVEQRDANLFVHDDMIQPDVISGRWLPFLNAHSR